MGSVLNFDADVKNRPRVTLILMTNNPLLVLSERVLVCVTSACTRTNSSELRQGSEQHSEKLIGGSFLFKVFAVFSNCSSCGHRAAGLFVLKIPVGTFILHQIDNDTSKQGVWATGSKVCDDETSDEPCGGDKISYFLCSLLSKVRAFCAIYC